MKEDGGQRGRVRTGVWALGLLVLFLYLGFIVLVALRNPGAVG